MKKYSPAIRITTGLLGLGGAAAIGFEAFQEGDLQFDVMLFLMLLLPVRQPVLGHIPRAGVDIRQTLVYVCKYEIFKLGSRKK